MSRKQSKQAKNLKKNLEKREFLMAHAYDFQVHHVHTESYVSESPAMRPTSTFLWKCNTQIKIQGHHVHTESCISESPWGPHHNFLGAVHKLCCLKIGNFWPTPPMLSFLLSKLYLVNRLWGYPPRPPPYQDDIVYGQPLMKMHRTKSCIWESPWGPHQPIKSILLYEKKILSNGTKTHPTKKDFRV